MTGTVCQQVQAGPSGHLAQPKELSGIFLGEKNIMHGYVILPQPLSHAIDNYMLSINPQLFTDCYISLLCCVPHEIQQRSKGLLKSQVFQFEDHGSSPSSTIHYTCGL